MCANRKIKKEKFQKEINLITSATIKRESEKIKIQKALPELVNTVGSISGSDFDGGKKRK